MKHHMIRISIGLLCMQSIFAQAVMVELPRIEVEEVARYQAEIHQRNQDTKLLAPTVKIASAATVTLLSVLDTVRFCRESYQVLLLLKAGIYWVLKRALGISYGTTTEIPLPDRVGHLENQLLQFQQSGTNIFWSFVHMGAAIFVYPQARYLWDQFYGSICTYSQARWYFIYQASIFKIITEVRLIAEQLKGATTSQAQSEYICALLPKIDQLADALTKVIALIAVKISMLQPEVVERYGLKNTAQFVHDISNSYLERCEKAINENRSHEIFDATDNIYKEIQLLLNRFEMIDNTQ